MAGRLPSWSIVPAPALQVAEAGSKAPMGLAIMVMEDEGRKTMTRRGGVEESAAWPWMAPVTRGLEAFQTAQAGGVERVRRISKPHTLKDSPGMSSGAA